MYLELGESWIQNFNYAYTDVLPENNVIKVLNIMRGIGRKIKIALKM